MPGKIANKLSLTHLFSIPLFPVLVSQEGKRQGMEIDKHQMILAQLRTALEDLADVQNELKKNASESKNDIHSHISRQLESLRTREVWLINQVDTVLQVKQEHLQHQAESLSKEVGALEYLSEKGKSSGAFQDIENIMKRFQQISLSPVEDSAISFQGESKRLKQAIHSFGSISPKRPRLANDGEGSSMDTQHVSFIGKVMEPFEQFAKDKVWLTERKGGEYVSQGTTQHMAYPIFEDKDTGTCWLLKDLHDGYMMVDSTSSGQGEEQGSFVMVPQESTTSKPDVPVSNHFASILTSPHVQWIRSKPNSAPSEGTSRHQAGMPYSYHQPCGNPKEWLRGGSTRSQKEGEGASSSQEMDVDQFHNSCGHAAAKPTMPVEIEDLAELACVQDTPSGSHSPCSPKTSIPPPRQQQQQRKQDKNSREQSPAESPCCSSAKTSGVNIEDVCKANEKCKSLDECLGDENCANIPASNDWLRQTKGVSESPMQSSSKQQDQGSSQSKDVQQWLTQDVHSTSSGGHSSIVTGFLKWQAKQQDGDSDGSKSPDQSTGNQWLKNGESNRIKTSTVSENLGCDEFKNKMNLSEWLRPNSGRSEGTSTKEMLSQFFEADDSMWVKGGSGDRASSPKATENQNLPQKWLLTQAYSGLSLTPKHMAVSYFSPQTSLNQWLKK